MFPTSLEKTFYTELFSQLTIVEVNAQAGEESFAFRIPLCEMFQYDLLEFIHHVHTTTNAQRLCHIDNQILFCRWDVQRYAGIVGAMQQMCVLPPRKQRVNGSSYTTELLLCPRICCPTAKQFDEVHCILPRMAFQTHLVNETVQLVGKIRFLLTKESGWPYMMT